MATWGRGEPGMQCANGHQIADQQKFCSECGAPALWPADPTVEHTQVAPILPPQPPSEPPVQTPPEAPHGWSGLSKGARWGMVTAAALVILGSGTATALLATGSSTEPGVSTWLCSGATNDLLIQWPGASGTINGSYQYAELTGTAPDQQVSTSRGNVTGQTSGAAITVNVGDRGDWYGSIHGDQMTLNIPSQDGTIQPATCQHSTVTAWNQAIAALGSQGSSANASASAAAAQAQQLEELSSDQQSLVNDVQQLTSDAKALDTDKTLASDVATANKDLATEMSDWNLEQHDSCSNLQTDSGAVANDSGSVSNDVGSLTDDTSTVSNGLSGLQGDLSSIQTDLSNIQSLGGTPGTNSAAAVAAGNKTVRDTKKAITWATQQGNALNSSSQAIAQQASDFANAHGC